MGRVSANGHPMQFKTAPTALDGLQLHQPTSRATLLIASIRSTPLETFSEKIGPGVLDTLRREGEAQVMIALAQPQVDTAQAKQQGSQLQIARLQNNVLAELKPTDFSLRIAYKSVSAIAGKLLNEQALLRLAENPHVLKIDLDEGGSNQRSTDR